MIEPSQTTCLEQLFGVENLEAFLAEFWPRQSTVRHGPAERFGTLSSLPALSDVEQLLNVFRDPVMVILPDERDESSAVKVDARAALKLYQNGMALCFESVEAFLPGVDHWLQTIRRELGLPSATWARALVYAGRSGAGNRPHYDANANIVVQLQGTKRWTLAANTDVLDPTDRWTMTTPHLPAELADRTAAAPREMPADAQVIELVQGSVLLVPRGYWHATEVGSEDTLALNFTYSQPTWAEVLNAALLNRLHRVAGFRGLADGLESSNPTRQRASEGELARMLEQLKAQVAGLSLEDVLAELLGSPQG